MQIIPAPVRDGRFDLYVILEQENIDRIKTYDPAVIQKKSMGLPWEIMMVRDVVLCFATPEDLEKIAQINRSGGTFAEVRKLLLRGYKDLPQDQDGPYTKLV